MAGVSRGREPEQVLFLPLLLGGIVVTFGSYLVLVGGVAGSFVAWLPQPAFGTLVTAFWMYLVANICLVLVTLGSGIDSLPTVRDIALICCLVGVIVVPVLYVLIYASTTVWAALPDSLEAQASFLFLLASLIGTLSSLLDD